MNNQPSPNVIPLSRRAFIQSGALVLMGSNVAFPKEETTVRVGLMTDLHYADKESGGSRHYRDSKQKIAEAVKYFNQSPPDFVIELGDIIDRAVDVKTELSYLKTIEAEYSKLACQRHYVFGNHCLDTLTKEEFIANTGMSDPYHSFDKHGYHFVVLDSCYNSKGADYQRRNFSWTDANIPDKELRWLAADLKANKKPTIVFAHQRLDPSTNHSVKNAEQVRRLLEQSGNVQAVFQGHSHKNDYQLIKGIHYCVVRAMVEGPGETNSGYGLLTIEPDGRMVIEGFRKQDDYRIQKNKKTTIKHKETKKANPTSKPKAAVDLKTKAKQKPGQKTKQNAEPNGTGNGPTKTSPQKESTDR